MRIGEAAGCDFSLLRETECINAARIARFLALIAREPWVLRGKRIALWGLAFKPYTDDVRFAPALEIARRLLAAGAELCAYDPRAMLVLTEWPEFCPPDWEKLRPLVARPLIFDGRNAFSPQAAAAAGFAYFGVGRPTPAPAAASRGGTATSGR